MQKWLAIVGIGETGLTGLSPVGRSLLANAEIVVGGRRHLAMLPAGDRREKRLWTTPITDSIEQIVQRRGQAVCVLASGDPMWYGVGVLLARRVPDAERTIVPAPSAFSFACACLGWSLATVETLSLCGRSPALLRALLYPGAQILALSADRTTPATVAQLLVAAGFGASKITVLEHLGGPQERLIQGIAASWHIDDLADLNLLAIACLPDTDCGTRQQSFATPYSRLPGLPDPVYHHDGQLTKRDIRAVTLSALAPVPGELLWDVGAGCGSISIEWLRSDRRCRAIAIERHPERQQYIADNANALGVPHLEIIAGAAPAALQNLPQPNAIFIGGGLTRPGVFTACWQALRGGDRLVANAVTVEGEQFLFTQQQQFGGSLTRLAVQRAEPVGQFLGWKAMAPITQWRVLKA
ncbi:MAG: precorrin-6y C5,15-methyltransferase (decarboxylating) subunit CbiE [Spirulinaceae cyanobacterium SM2_1_0]|nr:precorrin-6y C5,15-methyltransferase (decarboxylating) subunit CbiE [Spirulinaceae cyanobacterium SM2_1_0]